MLFTMHMLDRPDSATLRAEVSADHREFIGRHLDAMYLGGPLLSDDGKTNIGSMIVMDFPDRAAGIPPDLRASADRVNPQIRCSTTPPRLSISNSRPSIGGRAWYQWTPRRAAGPSRGSTVDSMTPPISCTE